jgi:hypothetical protein
MHLFLFIYLCKTYSNMSVVDNKSERIWKKAVVVYFEVLHQHLDRGTEEN